MSCALSMAVFPDEMACFVVCYSVFLDFCPFLQHCFMAVFMFIYPCLSVAFYGMLFTN